MKVPTEWTAALPESTPQIMARAARAIQLVSETEVRQLVPGATAVLFVKTVLEAIREPTSEMVDAAEEMHGRACDGNTGMGEVWRCMIDELSR